jgi:hypothetical protein
MIAESFSASLSTIKSNAKRTKNRKERKAFATFAKPLRSLRYNNRMEDKSALEDSSDKDYGKGYCEVLFTVKCSLYTTS